MLIKNFVTHLFDQNWGLLLTEFLVVVFGVIVGLQANEWYEERERIEQADYHLDFIHDQLKLAVISAKAELKENEEVFDGAGRALDLLSMKAWTEEEFEEFNQKINSAFHLWGPKKRPVALRRMTDDGKIDLLQDRDIQSAILRFDDDYIEAIEQTKTAYLTSMHVTLGITNRIHFERGRIMNSPEELLSDRDLHTSLRSKLVWQRIQLEVLESLQRSRIELLESLSRDQSTKGL